METQAENEAPSASTDAIVTPEIKLTYHDTADKPQKGLFKLRFLRAAESMRISESCHRRNLRTGQDLGMDDVKCAQMRVAAAVTDCPILVQNKPWIETTDLDVKGRVLSEQLDERMFSALVDRIAKMQELTPETENL